MPTKTGHTHSPLPWKYDDGSIRDKNGAYLFDVYMTDNIQFSGQDNATFVVNAVNSHTELLEALQACLPCVKNTNDEGPEYEGWQSKELKNIITKAEQAIERAKGI